MTTDTSYKFIDSESDLKTIRVTTPLGYTFTYKIKPELVMSDTQMYDKEIPSFSLGLNLEFVSATIHKDTDVKTVQKELSQVSLLPKALSYDHLYIGFVYDSDQNPYNHMWWVDVRDKDDNPVYNLYANDISVNSYFTSHSWMSNNFNHGRIRIDKEHIDTIIQDGQKFIIKGKTTIDTNNFTQLTLPKLTNKLRLRYNIKEDYWYCEFLDKMGKVLQVLRYTKISGNIPIQGTILMIGNSPKVSMTIKDPTKIYVSMDTLRICK